MKNRAGFIAIVGRPNVGKSSLLNAILGTGISIVTSKAQTTRNKILGIFTEEKRGQIVFVDTPGIHRAKEGGINEWMVNEARQALEDPSLVWYLLDPASALKHEEIALELLSKTKAPVMLVINKIDLISSKNPVGKLPGDKQAAVAQLENEVVEALKSRGGINLVGSMRVSALKKRGIKELLEASWSFMEEGPSYYNDQDQLSDRPTRFFVEELIREQLFLCLGAEVPYSCAVEVEKFVEGPKPRIEAVIFVERESQKGIVIGNGGSKIKEIGQAARKRIEAFLDTKNQNIFLGLRVKVLKEWTSNAAMLKLAGFK